MPRVFKRPAKISFDGGGDGGGGGGVVGQQLRIASGWLPLIGGSIESRIVLELHAASVPHTDL